MELLAPDLRIYRMWASEPFRVGGTIIYDVANNGNRLFTLISVYQAPIETDGKVWRCDYLLEPENFAVPMEERIAGQSAGKKVYRAASVVLQASLDDAAALLSSNSGNTPLVGLEWEFTHANGEFADDAEGWPTQSRITCPTKVTSVEPVALETVADALQMIRDAIKYQQDQKALADQFGRPRRLALADADALAAERLRERRRRRMQGLGL